MKWGIEGYIRWLRGKFIVFVHGTLKLIIPRLEGTVSETKGLLYRLLRGIF